MSIVNQHFAGTWDFARLVVTRGSVPITGFAEGDSLAVAPTADQRFRRHVGPEGESTWSKNNDMGARVTLRLQYGKAAAALLEAMDLLDVNTGHYAQPITIEDLNSGRVFAIAQARRVTDPSFTFGPDVPVTEYVYETPHLITTPGTIVPTPLG